VAQVVYAVDRALMLADVARGDSFFFVKGIFSFSVCFCCGGFVLVLGWCWGDAALFWCDWANDAGGRGRRVLGRGCEVELLLCLCREECDGKTIRLAIARLAISRRGISSQKLRDTIQLCLELRINSYIRQSSIRISEPETVKILNLGV
jgi:hypothetical protein